MVIIHLCEGGGSLTDLRSGFGCSSRLPCTCRQLSDEGYSYLAPRSPFLKDWWDYTQANPIVKPLSLFPFPFPQVWKQDHLADIG